MKNELEILVIPYVCTYCYEIYPKSVYKLFSKSHIFEDFFWKYQRFPCFLQIFVNTLESLTARDFYDFVKFLLISVNFA